jgi:cell division protease FtsH
MKRAVDEAVRTLVSEAHQRATQLLFANRAVLDRVATALFDRESLEGRELEQMLS